MSRRHTLARPLIGAGAAGLAGVAGLFALAPVAHAAPSDAPSSTASDTGTTTPAKAKIAVDDMLPNYGTQKARVGVRIKDGSYAPPSTTTVGTTITIVDTPPASTPPADPPAEPTTTTCTTEVGTVDSEDTSKASFCTFPDRAEDRVTSGRAPAVVAEPGRGNDFDDYYDIAEGHSVTITQTTVRPNLVVDDSTVTVGPCVDPLPLPLRAAAAAPDADLPACPSNRDVQYVFEDTGLPPVATADSATTKEGVAVPIAIESNDTPKAPLDGVKIVDEPDDGTVRLIAPESAPSTSSPVAVTGRAAAGSRSLAAVSSYRAVYTPAAGFTGVDTFDYTITTANGTATARVTVTVTGSAASASVSATGASGSGSSGTAPLADTGTQSGDLLGYAAALIAAGGGALAVGRQRRRGRHAR